MVSSEDFDYKTMLPCHRMPWMMRLEDEVLPESQLGAVYQRTRLDYEMLLNAYSAPKRSRLTSIIVTLGNMNSHPAAVADIVAAGANIVRLNLSHKHDKWHVITVESIREAGNKIYGSCCDIYPIAIAMDLCGPEIRTGIFNGDVNSMGYATLVAGRTVKLYVDEAMQKAGTATFFWISYPDLLTVCRAGDRILIDRGAVELRVICIGEGYVACRVVKGGVVRDSKIVELLDCPVELPQISETDDGHISLAFNMECDFVIVSHVRNGKTILNVKSSAKEKGRSAIGILAKIDSHQAVEFFDDILKAADGIILDTAAVEVYMEPEKLFLVRKSIIAKCNRVGKPVILTVRPKMEESSGKLVDPNNLAQAILEGVDGIFLTTGEMGVNDTVELVKKVDQTCRTAECARWQRQIFEELSYKGTIPLDPAHSVAVGAVETSLKCNASAIVVTTTTGRSAMLLSIYRPRCPVLAVTRHGIVARLLQLYFAIHPYHYRACPLQDWQKDVDTRVQKGIDYLRAKNYISVGDALVIVTASRQGTGFTNCMRVIYASPGLVQNRCADLEI